jgi:hypothetical protein
MVVTHYPTVVLTNRRILWTGGQLFGVPNSQHSGTGNAKDGQVINL